MWNVPTHENGTFVSQSNPSVGGWKLERPGFASATFLLGERRVDFAKSDSKEGNKQREVFLSWKKILGQSCWSTRQELNILPVLCVFSFWVVPCVVKQVSVNWQCTMCTCGTKPSAGMNKLGHILKFVFCYTIQHIFVPFCSVRRNMGKFQFSWASNSKFVIFSQIFSCSNYSLDSLQSRQESVLRKH